MAEALSPALRAVSDAVLAVASRAARSRRCCSSSSTARASSPGARYAALGIPDGEGGFSRFLVAGMSDELIASLGPLPRTHGMLGAMLETAEPFRTDDIHADPRFRGWWPAAHPDMRSFLGVPIVAGEGVIGAFYLTEKEDGPRFDPADQELIELLAAHAAIAITNARLYERSRELSVVSRAQPARARAPRRRQPEAVQRRAHRRGGGDPARPRPEAARAAGRAGRGAGARVARRAALADRRAAPARARARRARRAPCASTSRRCAPLHPATIELELERGRRASSSATARCCGSPRRRCTNALRHAARDQRSSVRLGDDDGALELEVGDDGIGFDPDDPELRARRLGLTSMEERAARLGGALEIRSAAGTGTTRAPAGRRGWLTRSRSCWSTTTRSSARGCAPSSSSRTGSRSSARPPTARRRPRGRAAAPGRDPDGPRDAEASTASARCASCAGACPQSRVIVLTSFADDDRLLGAIRAGAAGYLLKNAEPQEVARAVRAASAGQALLDPRSPPGVVESIADRESIAGAESLTRARARGPRADRPRALEQADRARARDLREDGQDPRRPRARQARGDRPHAGGAARRPHRDRPRRS